MIGRGRMVAVGVKDRGQREGEREQCCFFLPEWRVCSDEGR